jgi:amidase
MQAGISRLIDRNATELARLIRAREVSSREVIEAHLARIDEVNGAVGAVTVPLRASALAAADACDRAAEPVGPLHGVPFTVKENIDCLGSATTHGVPILREALPDDDAPIVARLKAAGAVLLARTNMSEMGLRLDTWNPLRGRTMNPYDPRLTAGGSSGGDAAAVATGMTPLGLGNDLGSSLRIPAHCCGVAALKPTTGRIPHVATLPPRDHGLAGQLMLSDGPIARSVGDLRLALSILAGRDLRDPRSVDVPLTGRAPAVRRAALVTRLPGTPLDENGAAAAAIRRAGAALQAAGWEIVEALPPELDLVNDLFAKVLAADLAAVVPDLGPFVSPELSGLVRRLCLAGRLDETTTYRVHTERSRLARAWSTFFADHPVVVGPTWARPVWPIDADLDAVAGVELLQETVRFTTPGNLLGLPSVVLPMGPVDGLPTGVQVYADLWREDLCLDAAEVIERASPPVTAIDPIVF